jgi:hypothetical protein
METLPQYLFEHLLQVLRRDMRREEYEAIQTPSDAQAGFYHGVNARFNQEILEYLKPKQGQNIQCPNTPYPSFAQLRMKECLTD